MARSKNADLAVALFDQIVSLKSFDKNSAWKAIAELLLSCEIWQSGWQPFRDVVVFREVNDFRKAKADHTLMQRAEKLTEFLASELGYSRQQLCSQIGRYWKLPEVRDIQPHNPVGHAFRSLLVCALQRYGDPEIEYEEEADPRSEFPGYDFGTRSKRARIDIMARRKGLVVALISSRWRFRHDRVDVLDEAIAYSSAARRINPRARFYAWIGEFSPSRVTKILENCPPAHSNAAINAAVHFNPALIREGLGENGRLKALQSLSWLVDQTHGWR